MKQILIIACILVAGCHSEPPAVVNDPIWYTPDCECFSETADTDKSSKYGFAYSPSQETCPVCKKKWRPLDEFEIGAVDLTMKEVAAHMKGIDVPMSQIFNAYAGEGHMNGIYQEKQCDCTIGVSNSYSWAKPLICQECGTPWKEIAKQSE